GATAGDPLMIAMHRAVRPYREARDDYDIFAGLAERLGIGETFTEGRSARQWLEQIYEPTRRALAERGINAPAFDEFWEAGELSLPADPWDGGMTRAFRRGHALLSARQPERLDPRSRHHAPDSGLHRPAHARRDRAVRRPVAAGQSVRPATRRLTLNSGAQPLWSERHQSCSSVGAGHNA